MSEIIPKKVLVVGDVMLDRYTYVTSERQAPEAPIPVWDVQREEYRLGGAANTAHNLKALAGDEMEVYLAGIIGHDDRKRISKLGIDTVLCAGTETMVKHRFVREQEYLFRADSFKKFSETSKQTFAKSLDHFLRGHMFDAIVISDYDKGTIDQDVVNRLGEVRNWNKGCPIVVDSKRVDLSLFQGSTILKLNEHEYAIQVARGPYRNVEHLFDYVVVTKGSKGAELREQARSVTVQEKGERRTIWGSSDTYIVNTEDFPVISVPAKDVTGCGDTHTAAMTFSMLKNNDVRSAVRFANACARSVVQKFGTSVAEKVV